MIGSVVCTGLSLCTAREEHADGKLFAVCAVWLSLCYAREEHDLKYFRSAQTPGTPGTPGTVDQIRRYIGYHARSVPRYVTGENLYTRYTRNILFLSGLGLLELRKWISTFLRARYKAKVA